MASTLKTKTCEHDLNLCPSTLTCELKTYFRNANHAFHTNLENLQKADIKGSDFVGLILQYHYQNSQFWLKPAENVQIV